MSNNGGVARRFLRASPPRFLEGALKALAQAYDTSKDRAEDEFEETEASYFAPHLRRALIERDVAGFASRIPGISVERVRTGAPRHRRIEFPGYAMTIARVRESGQLVRHAAHREFYASSNLSLFAPIESFERPVYAILIHGGRIRLEFARVVFPDAELKEYVDYIDLLVEFPHVIAEIRDQRLVPEEVVDERFEIRVRPIEKRKAEKEPA